MASIDKVRYTPSFLPTTPCIPLTVTHTSVTSSQEAIRKEPDAWSLLTEGKATLQSKLLAILWSDAEFAPHKTELLELCKDFGLVVPVRS